MEYYLAFSRGDFYTLKNRYVIVPFTGDLKNFDCEDNLQALCEFTCRFHSMRDLKNEIIRNSSEFERYKYYDLVLLWHRKCKGETHVQVGRILLKKDRELLDTESLTKFITQNTNLIFWNQIYKNYSNDSRIRGELANLLNVVDEGKTENIILIFARKFINKLCYDKNGFNYFNLYEFAAFISKLLELLYLETVIIETSTTNENLDSDCIQLSLEEPVSKGEIIEFQDIQDRARVRSNKKG